ncbi:MAG: hypothetical protein M1588_04320, partial [Planctomycetes bacterium]|nr:hypothetical protein [Planctomycetota bacterium]
QNPLPLPAARPASGRAGLCRVALFGDQRARRSPGGDSQTGELCRVALKFPGGDMIIMIMRWGVAGGHATTTTAERLTQRQPHRWNNRHGAHPIDGP